MDKKDVQALHVAVNDDVWFGGFFFVSFLMLSKRSDFQTTTMNNNDDDKNAYMRAICSIDPIWQAYCETISEAIRRQRGVRAQTVVLSDGGDNLILWCIEYRAKFAYDPTNTRHLGRVWGGFIRRYSLIDRLR